MKLLTRSGILLPLSIAALVLTVPASADAIYSSTCDAYSYPTVTGTTSCQNGVNSATGGSATAAESSVSLTIASAPGVYSLLSGYENATAVSIDTPQGNGAFIVGGSSAITSVSFSQELTTPGPIRQGLLYAVLSGGGSREGDYSFASSSATVPSSNVSAFFPSGLGCDASFYTCQDTEEALAHYSPIAFTLGQTFTLNYSGSAYAYATGLESSGSESTTVLSFRFTELDGTPVPLQVSDAPEPSELGLLGLGAGALVLLRKSFTIEKRSIGGFSAKQAF